MASTSTDPNDRSYTLPGVTSGEIGLLVLGYGDTTVEVDDTFAREVVGDWWKDLKKGTHGDVTLYGGDAAKQAAKANLQDKVVGVAGNVGLVLVTGGGNLHSAQTNATTIDTEDHITVSVFNTDDIDTTVNKLKHIGMVHIYTDDTTHKYKGYVVVKKNGTILPKTLPSIFAWEEARTKKT